MDETANLGLPKNTPRRWNGLLGARPRLIRTNVERLPDQSDPSDFDRWDYEVGRTLEAPKPETK